MHDCNLCKLQFKWHSDLKRHYETKKHKEKLKNPNVCPACFKEFSTAFNKKRHEKNCHVAIQNQTNITNNIQTQNNITNNITNNIQFILPDNPEAIKTFVTTVAELKAKRTTDCFQKLILDEMMSKKTELMDYIEKFDSEVELAKQKIIHDHNISCSSYKIIKKIDEDGNEYEEEIDITPLTHPEKKWNCRHAKSDFKLNDDMVSQAIANTLLDDEKPVVTHDNDLNGVSDLLFKHENDLHSDNILLKFLSRSNKQDCFNLSKDYKPSCKIKEMYPTFYERIEAKAIKIMNAFNEKTKKSSNV